MPTRRNFLSFAAAAVGTQLLPTNIRKALAIPAHRVTRSIEDVKHVVIFMEENRSFDHYFGTLRGVRGFGDPRPAHLPNGATVWKQPPARIKTERYKNRGLSESASYVLPFYIDPKRTTEFQAGTDHGWSSGHQAWNHGRYNQWVEQKQDVLTMGYLKRDDLSYHYALADAFTICDAYHASVFADTAPNRICLWSGTVDPANRLGTKPNGPGLWERHHVNGYTYTTYPELLQAKGISWKLYQGGSGEPGTPTDNYTDNSLEFFAAYQVQEGASPTGPLVTNGVTNHTLMEFRNDVVNGNLAQVTWIVSPYKYSEHPSASPRDGSHYINLVLEALTADPEVWGSTVLILDYDENDGLFDHIIPPMPVSQSKPNSEGMLSADLVPAMRDEFLDLDTYPRELGPLVPGADLGGLQPVGLGPRVPLLLISPWTTGGWVCSETFDHTSVLRFLETRFGVEAPNISAWRRSICGDLTSAFDFSGTDQAPAGKYHGRFVVPEPIHSLHQPYQVPVDQVMPVQERGVRPARPLPYRIYTDGDIKAEEHKFEIKFRNEGKIGAAFYARNNLLPDLPPRRYSVSAGNAITDFWPISHRLEDKDRGKPRLVPDYDLELHGPNGFFSHFRGVYSESGASTPEIRVHYNNETGALSLSAVNPSSVAWTFRSQNACSPGSSHSFTVQPRSTSEDRWDLKGSANWFDITVTAPASGQFLRRFAGHVETGKPSTSDPLTFTQAQKLEKA